MFFWKFYLQNSENCLFLNPETGQIDISNSKDQDFYIAKKINTLEQLVIIIDFLFDYKLC